ncbi:MAG: hypothetical protein LC648_04815 [Novosphingobium sp.]|nr:hypothetical protein [Novosphingobium sp.]
MTLPPWIVVVPGASVVSEVSAAVPPTGARKIVSPEVLTASVWPPFNVLAKSIAPAPVLASVVAPPSVTASP